MADVHNKDSRQKNMAAIRSKNSRPERFIRLQLATLGFHYVTNKKSLPGTPDIVIKKFKAIIFVNGCFWHGHNCHLFKVPQTNTKFWISKIHSNTVRDKEVVAKLMAQGWRILIVWECSMKGANKLRKKDLLDRMEEWILRGDNYSELSFRGLTRERFKPRL
ncbi:very short patch repair endonuclease [Pseudoalteromonas sp. PPB1]|uniref:very short patch repair endonuclease n=1 Tax=Pseudoalteromonas sp. PPB1 TaxID=2756136 RepID=UPI0018917386|nr:DNA mismatch endonuclease Vsr [Pseudoalteromonas sp. PPB1]